jgi:hypothetical protein
MARACIREGHEVSVYDNDSSAFERFKGLYKERYGVWDDIDEGVAPSDLFVVATPPDTHLSIIQDAVKFKLGSKVLVEKPLCLPHELKDMPEVMVNYNHLHSHSFKHFRTMNHFCSPKGKKPDKIEVNWRESVDYILKAHPWIESIEKSYLGDYKRGGGSAYEHSHGMACALALFKDLKREDITDLKCDKKMQGNYDEYMKIEFVIRDIPISVTTDFTSQDVDKSITLTQADYFSTCIFGSAEDCLKWERNGGFANCGFPAERNDQFVRGLNGALAGSLDTNNIGRLAVAIIGEAHEL